MKYYCAHWNPLFPSVLSDWCKRCRGIMVVFVPRAGMVCVWVCVRGIGVRKVKVTWSVPVTVQWENQSTPVNEVGQVHKPSQARLDMHARFFSFLISHLVLFLPQLVLNLGVVTIVCYHSMLWQNTIFFSFCFTELFVVCPVYVGRNPTALKPLVGCSLSVSW